MENEGNRWRWTKKTRSRATRIETNSNVKQRSTEVKHESDTGQEPIRNKKQSTCAGHGRARKWGADWVPSMVVQPTDVVYSFLMECPIPSTESKMKNKENRLETEKERSEQKERKKKNALKGNPHTSQDGEW